MRSQCFCVVTAVFCLAACVTPSREEVNAEVGEAVGAQVPELPNDWRSPAPAEPVQVGWIDSFNDATLVALVEEAQANNRNLAAAAANVTRARALARQAGAELTPDIGLGFGADRAAQLRGAGASPATGFTAGLDVSWEADVWGRVRSGVRAAQASAQAIEADYRYAQHSLAANTAIAYFTAVEASIQTGIARDTLGVLDETLRIVSAQFDNGMASAQDISLTRSDLAAARERVTTLEGAHRNALRALELLLGRYPGADLSVRATLPSVPAPPPAGVPSSVLERRPDLIAAERRVAAAFNAVDQAQAARLPTIGLTGNIGGASNSLTDLLSPQNVAWQLGTSLLAPIFDGGRRRENVNISTAEQEQALAAYGDTALRAFSELETGLDQGVVLDQRETDLQEAADQASEAYRIADLRYKEGETSLLDLLTIQQRVIGTRSSLSSVQRLLLEQRVNLNLALGGRWQP